MSWPLLPVPLFPPQSQGAGLCHVTSSGEKDSGWSPQPGGQASHDPPLAAPCEQEQSSGAAHAAGVQRAEPGKLPLREHLQAKQPPHPSSGQGPLVCCFGGIFLETLRKT